MDEVQAWLKKAEKKLPAEPFALLNARLKEVLKGQVSTLKDYQTWSATDKGGAIELFLATGADPGFLDRFAQEYLPSFLRPVFNGMVKTRYRPSRQPLAREKGVRGTTAAAAFAAAVAVKQEKHVAAAFYAPGSEEEYQMREGQAARKRVRKEAEEGGGGGGGGMDENKDRNVIERLQHVLDRGLGGKKRKETAAEERARRQAAAAASGGRQQKCQICHEVAPVYMSPCGHIACISCWKKWVSKAPAGRSTCFYKCMPVTLNALKRVLAGTKKEGGEEGGGGAVKREKKPEEGEDDEKMPAAAADE